MDHGGDPGDAVAAAVVGLSSISPGSELPAAFAQAFAAGEMRDARALIKGALSHSATPGRLYAQAVRPALVQLAQTSGPRAHLSAGAAAAILADLAAAQHNRASRGAGAGRRALLRCAEEVPEAFDAVMISDFLESDGWSVERVPAAIGAKDLAGAARAGAVELVTVVVSDAADALRMAPACTELRRLADVPVIALADFSPSPRRRQAAVSMGADVVAHDPDELVGLAAERSPAPGRRRWGVALTRNGSLLTLAPTGRLDTHSAERLVDVASSRSGTFARLTLDLRDLAVIDDEGLAGLAGLSRVLPGVEVRFVAGDEVKARLAARAGVPPSR